MRSGHFVFVWVCKVKINRERTKDTRATVYKIKVDILDVGFLQSQEQNYVTSKVISEC